VGTLHLCPASPSRGGLSGLTGVTTRPAGYPSGGVPPATERQLHSLTDSTTLALGDSSCPPWGLGSLWGRTARRRREAARVELLRPLGPASGFVHCCALPCCALREKRSKHEGWTEPDSATSPGVRGRHAVRDGVRARRRGVQPAVGAGAVPGPLRLCGRAARVLERRRGGATRHVPRGRMRVRGTVRGEAPAITG
jgi:hypothetical protein